MFVDAPSMKRTLKIPLQATTMALNLHRHRHRILRQREAPLKLPSATAVESLALTKPAHSVQQQAVTGVELVSALSDFMIFLFYCDVLYFIDNEDGTCVSNGKFKCFSGTGRLFEDPEAYVVVVD